MEQILAPKRSEEEYDESIFPMLDQSYSNGPEQQYQSQEAKQPKISIELGKNSYEDYYGFMISSILAALLGYFIFANGSVIGMYSGVYSGFYESENVISTKGRIMQVALVALLHAIASFWLL